MSSPLTEMLDSKKQLRLFLDELENIANAVKLIQPVKVEREDVKVTAPVHSASALQLTDVANQDLSALSTNDCEPDNQTLCDSAQAVVDNSWNTFSDDGAEDVVTHKFAIGKLNIDSGLAHTVSELQKGLMESVDDIYTADNGNGKVIIGHLENNYGDFPTHIIKTNELMTNCGHGIQTRVSSISQALDKNANMYTSSLGTVVGDVRHELVDQFAGFIFGVLKNYLARKMIGAGIATALFAALVPAAPGFIAAYKVLILGEKASKFISDIPIIGWVFSKVKSAMFAPIRGIFNGVYKQVNELFEIFGLG